MTMPRWILMLSLVAVAACAQRVETAPVAPSTGSDAAASSAPTGAPPPGPGGNLPPNPMIGGAPMYPSRDILDNLAQSPDHRTLVAALNVSGLAGTLRQGGPYTMFA